MASKVCTLASQMDLNHDLDASNDNATLAQVLPSTPEEMREWMRVRHIDEVECVVPDLVGVARGKAMPASKFSGFNPTYLPTSIFFQTITGNYIEMDHRDDFMMEKDIQLVPDLATLARCAMGQ